MDLISITCAALILVGALLVRVVGKLAEDEIRAWLPRIAAKRKDRAVRVLPSHMRDRYAEEWQAHLDGLPGDFGRVVVALGFNFAAYRHRCELIFAPDRISCARSLITAPCSREHYQLAVRLYHPFIVGCSAILSRYEPSNSDDFRQVFDRVAAQISNTEIRKARFQVVKALWSGECIPMTYDTALQPFRDRLAHDQQIKALKDPRYIESLQRMKEEFAKLFPDEFPKASADEL